MLKDSLQMSSVVSTISFDQFILFGKDHCMELHIIKPTATTTVEEASSSMTRVIKASLQCSEQESINGVALYSLQACHSDHLNLSSDHPCGLLPSINLFLALSAGKSIHLFLYSEYTKDTTTSSLKQQSEFQFHFLSIFSSFPRQLSTISFHQNTLQPDGENDSADADHLYLLISDVKGSLYRLKFTPTLLLNHRTSEQPGESTSQQIHRKQQEEEEQRKLSTNGCIMISMTKNLSKTKLHRSSSLAVLPSIRNASDITSNVSIQLVLQHFTPLTSLLSFNKGFITSDQDGFIRISPHKPLQVPYGFLWSEFDTDMIVQCMGLLDESESFYRRENDDPFSINSGDVTNTTIQLSSSSSRTTRQSQENPSLSSYGWLVAASTQVYKTSALLKTHSTLRETCSKNSQEESKHHFQTAVDSHRFPIIHWKLRNNVFEDICSDVSQIKIRLWKLKPILSPRATDNTDQLSTDFFKAQQGIDIQLTTSTVKTGDKTSKSAMHPSTSQPKSLSMAGLAVYHHHQGSRWCLVGLKDCDELCSVAMDDRTVPHILLPLPSPLHTLVPLTNMRKKVVAIGLLFSGDVVSIVKSTHSLSIITLSSTNIHQNPSKRTIDLDSQRECRECL